VKDVLYLFGVVLVKLALQTTVFSKFNAALNAIVTWLLFPAASETFDLGDLAEKHAVDLTALFELKLLVMANLTRKVNSTTGRLYMT
jgi:hypothetical protein